MKIKGSVRKIISPDKFNGNDKQFASFYLALEGDSATVLCSGLIFPIEEHFYLELEGDYQGNEFQFVQSRMDDSSEDASVSFMIFLFGKKTAYKIISQFNNSAMSAIKMFKSHEQYFRNECEKIKGIGYKKIDKAYSKYYENETADVIYTNFQQYGISLDESLKIFKNLGDKSLDKIKNNPYLLLNFNIDFLVVDAIATKYYGWSLTNKKRITAGIMYILLANERAGNIFIRHRTPIANEKTLVDLGIEMLKIEKSVLLECIIDLEKEKKIIRDKDGRFDIIYTAAQYEYETVVASKIRDFIAPTVYSENDIASCIASFERNKHLKLAELQKKAIINCCRNRCSIITGPPGSGKTTIIDAICYSLKKMSHNPNLIIKLAAPTGKAAERISSSTGKHAQTVHRLLGFSPQDGEFKYNNQNKLELDVLIIDEVSMLGIKMMYHLLRAMPDRGTIIFVGDSNQLLSVDSGKILSDMIESKCIPVIELNEIYRQTAGSTLSQRILDISQGITPSLLPSPDFEFIPAVEPAEVVEKALDAYMGALHDFSQENICLITPYNKGEAGVIALNNKIQNIVNPFSTAKPEIRSGQRVFRLNDLVIQTVNDDLSSVYNGDVGRIVEIVNKNEDNPEDVIVVDYGTKIAAYTRDKFENISLAYALTVHRTQGSEYKEVILIIHEMHRVMLTKRLFYTGISRAKKMIKIIGTKKAVEKAVKNTVEKPRNSLLRLRIQNECSRLN